MSAFCIRLCTRPTIVTSCAVPGRSQIQRRIGTIHSSRSSQQYRSHSSVSSAASSVSSPPRSSTVSQDEVSHFTKLASSWWDPHGPSRLLHLMNPLRHDFIQTCIRSDASTSKTKKHAYLDIGCGGGIFASSAGRLPSTESVTAIDPTPMVIQVAQAQQRSDPSLSEPTLTYLNCAIEDLQSQPGHEGKRYDIITLFEVVEHIAKPSAFLATALEHLKPGGWLIGSTIARHPLSYLTTKIIAEAPIVGVVPAGTHDWSQYINPGELKAWFGKQNAESQLDHASPLWSDVKIEGVVYVPFLGWRWINKSENFGNYFFGVQKLA